MNILKKIFLLLFEAWFRAFDFSGRSRRREFVIFAAEFIFMVYLIMVLGGARFGSSSKVVETLSGSGIFIIGLFAMLAIVPAVALQVRRLHDQNRSGWWILLHSIPFVGEFIWLGLMFWPGTEGDNRFGSNPRRAIMSQIDKP